MINVSREFRQLMNVRTDFKENAEITFANGTVINLAEKDFTISNNSVVDASGTNGIPLGVAICRSIQIELMNDDERFSDYDFFGARIRLFLTYQLSESMEKIEYGTFTVLTPETYGETVIITALDDMYKADRSYTTSLVFPATIGAMLRDACTTLGISQGMVTFANDNFVVNAMPTDITFRQLFGYIAMLAGGNARIDVTGRLRIITYDFNAIEDVYHIIDGGAFAPWSNPTELDGGDFTYNTGDVADGGNFTDDINYHILNNWSTLKVDTDDVVITGITTTYTDAENEEHTVMYGKEGYLLKVENPLIAGQEQKAVGLIGSVMVGGRFRQFSGDLVSDPTCEFMDVAAIVDRKNNVYVSFLTDINFQFFGFTNLKNSAEPTLRNSAQTYSDATKTLVAARKMINNERTAREQAVAQLAKDLASSSGLYMTQDIQPDKSIIYYMHDKPTLQESMIIWKLTALAFAISTDGGKTYPYGFTVDGTTITRLLYAEGIDADYIDTGALRIADTFGNTLFLADYDTKQVQINAANVIIGSKSLTSELDDMSAAISVNEENINLKVSKGDVSTQISVESGEVNIKSNRFSWESTFSSLTSDGKLKCTNAEISGTLTTTGVNEWTSLSTKAQLEDGTLKFFDGSELKTAFTLSNWGRKNPNGGYYENLIAQAIGTAWKGLIFGFLTANSEKVEAYYVINDGINPDGYTERHLFNGSVRFFTGPISPNYKFNNGANFSGADYDGMPSIISSGGFYANGSIGCSGTKYRVVDTVHYGKRGMNAFETAEAFFSDIGSGKIGENGECKIKFDPIFSETIDLEKPYQVQITPTSELSTTWVEKLKNYFIVHGDKGATFDWMLMCKQKDYSDIRMNKILMEE